MSAFWPSSLCRRRVRMEQSGVCDNNTLQCSFMVGSIWERTGTIVHRGRARPTHTRSLARLGFPNWSAAKAFSPSSHSLHCPYLDRKSQQRTMTENLGNQWFKPMLVNVGSTEQNRGIFGFQLANFERAIIDSCLPPNYYTTERLL